MNFGAVGTNAAVLGNQLANSPDIASVDVVDMSVDIAGNGALLIITTAATGPAGDIAVTGAGPLLAGAAGVGVHQVATGHLYWWEGELHTLTDGRRFRCTGSGDGTAATFAWLTNA